MSARDWHPFDALCYCGKRRGMHRYGDEPTSGIALYVHPDDNRRNASSWQARGVTSQAVVVGGQPE